MRKMEREEKFMIEALNLARQNIGKTNGGPFGAVIVKDGEIIARGVNNVIIDNDPTAHAEIVAIRDACEKIGSYQLEDCEIYASCEPCPMCLGAIYWARPKKVFYAGTRHDAENVGFDDSLIYNEINLPDHDRKIPFEQIFQDKARAIFNDWKNSENKMEY